MTRVSVALVEAPSICPVQPVHSSRKVWRRKRQQKMEVVGHEAVRETRPAAAVHRLSEKRDEHAPIGVVGEDRGASNAASRDVNHTLQRLDTRRASHRETNVERRAVCVEMPCLGTSAPDVATCLARFPPRPTRRRIARGLPGRLTLRRRRRWYGGRARPRSAGAPRSRSRCARRAPGRAAPRRRRPRPGGHPRRTRAA